MLEAVANAKLSADKATGSSTVMSIDLVDVGDLMLDTDGVALPKVPLQGLIQAYSFDLRRKPGCRRSARLFRRCSTNMCPSYQCEPMTVNGFTAPLEFRCLIRTPLGTLRYRLSGITEE